MDDSSETIWNLLAAPFRWVYQKHAVSDTSKRNAEIRLVIGSCHNAFNVRFASPVRFAITSPTPTRQS